MAVAKMKKLGQDDSDKRTMMDQAKDIGSAVGNTARTFLMPEAVPADQRVYQDSAGPVPPSQTPQPPNAWYQSYGRYAAPRMAPMYDEGGDVAPSPIGMPQDAFDPSGANVVGQNAIDSAAGAAPESGLHKAEDAVARAGQAMDDPSQMPGQTANTRMYNVQGLDRNYMTPMYDEGGKVPDLKKTPVTGMSSKLHNEVKMNMMNEPDKYPKSVANTKNDDIDPEELDRYNQEHAAKPQKEVHSGATDMYDEGGPVRMHSMYDDGGPVKDNPNDGHHQMAILEEGERVLTPEQNAQYEQEHGAPANFGGRVLQQPNPPVRPMMDTEVEAEQPMGGAKMDTSNPPAAQVSPTPIRMFDQGGTVPPKQEVPLIPIVDDPAMARSMSAQVAPQMQQQQPMPPQQPAQPAQPTTASATPAPAAGGAPQMQQPGAEAKPTEPNSMQVSASPKPLPSEREHLESERAALKQKMTDAALGTNNNGKFDHVAYGEAKMALADLNKMHPWGTPGNHEGIGGKIGHGLATAGEIASDVVLGPGVTAAIPGTKENLNLQSQQGAQQIEQGLGEQEKQADIGLKQAQAQMAGMPKTTDEAAARAQFKMQHTQPGTPEHEQAKKDYDAAVATASDVASAKNVKQLSLAQQIAMHSEKAVTLPEGSPERLAEEQQIAYLQAQNQASQKLVERQREILAHAKAMGIDDAATNQVSYDKAQKDFDKSQTVIKAEAGFPTWQKKADIQNSLATQRALLVQSNANANQYAMKGAELQQKADADYIKANGHIGLIKKAIDTSDGSQVAANIVPLMATLNVISDVGGVKRLNKQELDMFAPGKGSATRWLEANWDRIVAGELPDGYQTELKSVMDALQANVDENHNAYTQAVYQNFRQYGQASDVKQNPKGGTKVTPKKVEAPPPPSGNTAGKTVSASDWLKQRQQQPK